MPVEILGVCGSSREYRHGENAKIDVTVKNKSSSSEKFGVEIPLTEEVCQSTDEIESNSTDTVTFTYDTSSVSEYTKVDLVIKVYENTDCSGDTLDEKECLDIILVRDDHSIFKGENTYDALGSSYCYYSCSPSRDDVYYKVTAHYYVYYDGEWHHIKEIFDTGWECCADSDQTIKGYIKRDVPLSDDEVGQWSNICVGVYFWKEGDGDEVDPTCWDNDLEYLYEGER